MDLELTKKLIINFCTSQTAKIDIARTEADLCSEYKKHSLTDATIVIWQINKIVWGTINAGEIKLIGDETLCPELWQEIRIFNEAAEIHLVNKDNRLIGRLRCDSTGEGSEYVDTLSRFWGKIDSCADTIVLTDKNRKLTLELPYPKNIDQPPKEYLGLITRSYIGCNEKTAQSGYIDYRYVKISNADREGV